ncbi:MAG: hypothetical protein JO093_17700 [Acidobacteria bacterium]|nr:hypothetical protein [Acidobacteriota bacterium]MBV9067434.1 hypothetical protein [Acidobacteriota bacterium]MBV9187455.1 hypothetical protein [Acidobacteriota bacterium]
MQRLLHKDEQQFAELLRTLTGTFQLYDERKPELHDSLLALLDLAGATFKEHGRSERESFCASLRAEFTTALRGINPTTLEKSAVRRHEMQSSTAFRIMQALESQLRADLLEVTDTLHRAEDLIGQILLASIQKGLISDADIRDTVTQDAIETLWRSIASDADIALGEKRVLLIVSRFDVYLLIDTLLSGLRA